LLLASACSCESGSPSDLDTSADDSSDADSCVEKTLSGDFNLSVEDDVSALEGATQVNGTITCSSCAKASVASLSCIEEVDALALSSIDGSVSLGALAQLKKAGQVDLSSFTPDDQNVTLPALKEIDSLRLADLGRDVTVSLPSLETVRGRLTLRWLGGKDLKGLSNLREVGLLWLIDSESLETLEGLENLEQLEQLSLDTPKLEVFSGLELAPTDFFVLDNANLLKSLEGLPAFVQIRAFQLEDNNGLESLNGLVLPSTIGSTDTTGATLDLVRNQQLIDISALAGIEHVYGNIIFDENASLESLSGLENLRRVEGRLYITNNASLKNLNAIRPSTGSKIEWISDLRVYGNEALNGCEFFSLVEELRSQDKLGVATPEPAGDGC